MIKGKEVKIKEVPITSEMIEAAKVKDAEMGELKNSIRKGAGNLVGFIGEEVVRKYLGVSSENTYNYDLVKDDKRIEVKTKETTVAPKEGYDCSVAAYNTRQACEIYVFVRVLNDLSTAWILGYKNKKEYMKNSTLLKEGDFDPSNKYTVKADCYNMKISDLDNIKGLLDEQKKEQEGC